MTEITYRLPRTELVVTGGVRTSRDRLKLVDGQPKTATALTYSAVKLVTSADLSPILTVIPPTGRLSTYKGSFGVAPDGRLTSASADITGEAGAALKSLASLAGTAVAIAALDVTGAPKDDADDEQILAEYRNDHPDPCAAFLELRKARKKLDAQMRTEVGKVAAGSGDLAELRRVQALIAAIGVQLTAADGHFRTWRSSKVETLDQAFELRVALADIPPRMADAGWAAGGTATGTGPPKNLQELWERYGVGIEASWLGGSTTPRSQQEKQAIAAKTDHVYTRVAELLELRLVQAHGADVVETGRQRALVADEWSKVKDFKLKSSWFGRKSLALAFDADGFVSTVSVEGSSALAAGLAAAGGVTDGFTSGVEGGTKAFNAVRSAGRASLDAELARVKGEVELRQQRLLASGLDATTADTVELQRLQQLQGILDAQTKIAGVDPMLVANLAQRAGGDLAWYHAPGPAAPPEPQVIRIVMGPEPTPAPVPPAPPDLGGPRTGTK